MNNHLDAWFLAFPDCAAGASLANKVITGSSDILCYQSGRPWLVGRFPAHRVIVARAGATEVVLIGDHAIKGIELERLIEKTGKLPDKQFLTGEVPGSFYLAVSFNGDTRIQGTISGLRRICYAEYDGITLCGSHPSILAEVIGTSIDEQELSLYLLSNIPYPLSGRIAWQGVNAVPPGSFIQLDRSGGGKVRQWWQAPEPTLSLADGGERLREDLSAAVRVRTQMESTLSCDLSGGYDSTAVCFLANQSAGKLISWTVRSTDPGNDDLTWVDRISSHLSGVEQIRVGAEDLPDRYAEMYQAYRAIDEPSDCAQDFARMRVTAELLADRGSRLHMSGLGGDQVAGLSPSYLHATIRIHPLLALRYIRGYCSRFRWPMLPSLIAMLDRRSYHTWLRRASDQISDPEFTIRTPFWDWHRSPRIPPWATHDAATAAATLIRKAAADAEPLASTHGEHKALSDIQAAGNAGRMIRQAYSSGGLELSQPWLDDRVIEAGLSVLSHERSTPYTFKPLTAQALRGVVPHVLFDRHTKGAYDAEVTEGLRRHRKELCELLDNSRLAELGLIDPEIARGAVLGRFLTMQPWAITKTICTEAWLRQYGGRVKTGADTRFAATHPRTTERITR